MEIGGKRFLVCDCEGTMPLDGRALSKACGGGETTIHTHLCRAQIDALRRAAGEGRPLVVACTQEAPVFIETLDEIETAPPVRFVNIRERAGWSEQAARATAKIAALLVEAAVEVRPAPAVSLSSEGAVLVIGRDGAAIEAAKQLSGRLDATVLLTEARDVLPPALMDVPVFGGRIRKAKGHLGAFEVAIDAFAPAKPSSRGALAFEGRGQKGASKCDLILDLRGGPPLFPGPGKRDGYFNPDPGNPALVQKALFDLVEMVGTFEKPRYVAYDAAICAHARSGIVGCSRCLDICPAGAIAPAGDKVAFDAHLCAGCGSCASVCPTGAAAYAQPSSDDLLMRLRTLLGAYAGAGGADPVLLVHDGGHGLGLIEMMARLGRGLPANVLPFAVNQTTQVGLDFLLSAVAYGGTRVVLLLDPGKRDEAAGLAREVALAEAVLAGLGYGAGRVEAWDDADPAGVEERLYALAPTPGVARASYLSMGKKRALMGLALDHLHRHAPVPVDVLALPEGAPFGAIDVDTRGCTLCLACVGACPAGALKDNPDRPQLRFSEAACVQCGLCRATCPEKVIALVPRIDFTDEARAWRVLNEEEPFHCIRCGKPFGTLATISRLKERLGGHPMFAGNPRQMERMSMCEDCRVVAMTMDETHPLAGRPRPLVRTTEDYLRERDELRRQAAEAEARRKAGDDDG